ncbi:hypothetical protein G4D82_14095 [Flavobacterium sp. CYK-4]|uniref:hypothetical protein n=1 Tax=Flavobacterium lotistagni TaxID=2709660 RepID=UPI00140A2608|nr:hypothetical protein [Flavobacterium lotistagni]NHM08356.1 hypothetical protein [Flavobacterium lotistagni]
MREDDFINMIVNSFNSEFRTVDVHAYARKNGFIPIDIFTALNEAKHFGLIELQDDDFNTIRLTPFGERVKNLGGWFEYKFLDEKEQKNIRKPKKPKKDKKPKEVKIVEDETAKLKENKSSLVERLSWIVGIIVGLLALYEFVIKQFFK